MPRGWLGRVAAFLDQFAPVIDDLHALLTSNAVFIRRTAGVGVLAAGVAVDFGCTGPVLRGSGVDWDLRRDGEPLCTGMYEGYTYEVIAPKDGQYPTDHPYPPVPPDAVVGDCWHRYFVRMLEVVQSVYLVRQGIEKYTQAPGPVDRPIEVKKKLPKGEAYLETEAPKGQMGFMLIGNGTPVPWRGGSAAAVLQPFGPCPSFAAACWWATCLRSPDRWIWCWERSIGRDLGI